ncbi:hypothetical protein HJFPF1_00710 [Paramyrothecium foliicola]|nr:hypothetical protein HJFPF1_00710 [Paramyrothecium foliicola]
MSSGLVVGSLWTRTLAHKAIRLPPWRPTAFVAVYNRGHDPTGFIRALAWIDLSRRCAVGDLRDISMAANRPRAMVPLQLLLNPDAAESTALAVEPFASRPTSIAGDQPAPAVVQDNLALKPRRMRAHETSSRTEPRGPINFPPFQDLDYACLQLVANFDVKPFGSIHQIFEHFPYNSEKRDLLEKTGRESIEAFTYDFQVPGSDARYVVMWDYNIGIVRLASLFRLCGFNKTGPAQTFSKNPGLLEITPNVTGGAVPAQGKARDEELGASKMKTC